MKIVVISDTHGFLPKIEDDFDLLLIGGDIFPTTNHHVVAQMEWMTSFIEWVKGLPFKDGNSKVILVPGNHDFYLERATKEELKKMEEMSGERLKILRHDIYDFEYPVSDGIDALRIFGTPYCSIFGKWAFMVKDETLEKKFSQIPEGVDVLVSHDSPNINLLGAIMEGPFKNYTTGNKVLAKHVKRVKPKMFFSGHFHSGRHDFEEIDGTYMANVSFVDEKYKPYGNVLIIEYDGEKREIVCWENKRVNF